MAYVINLHECNLQGNYWITFFVNDHNVTYFNSFRVEYIPKEIERFIDNKNITTNIYRIQANLSIICGDISVGFIEFILKDKSLLDYTNFSPNEYGNNNKIILTHLNK